MPDHNFSQHNQTSWEMYQPDLTSEHPRHQRMLEPLISLYQDGEANEVESATVEQYLSACAECRAIDDSFKRLSGHLRNYLAAVPAPHFDRRAYSFLDESPTETQAGTVKAPRLFNPGGLPDDRLTPFQPRRARFAYSLAGGLAAVLLIGLVGAFLLLVSQQVPFNKDNNKDNSPVSNQAAVSSLTQDALAFQTPQTEGSPTTTTSAETTEPALPPSPTTANPAVTPLPDTRPPGQTVGAPTAVVAQKTQVIVPQKPLPTPTPIPVPTNTPVQSSRTTAATAQQPTATPTQSAAVDTTAPVETATPTRQITVDTPASLTVTPEPYTAVETTTVPPQPPATTTNSSTGAVAPGWIAYVDQSDGQIHLVKADGRDDEVISDPTVSRNFVYEQLVWSNDGKLLAAVGQNTNNGMRNVYLLDIANPLRVEALAEGFAPAWSPDNLSIAFLASPITVKDGVRYGRPAIFSLKKRTVSFINTLTDSLAPQWFDDGSRLLIGQDRIYDLNTGLTGTFKLPFNNTCLAAALSPSGDKLANLELQANGDYQTVIYDLSKGQLEAKKPLARATAPIQGKIGINCGSQRVRWTPDSRYIYYYVNNGGAPATCLVQADGGSSRCLTNVYDPSFNSDSTALVDISLTAGGDGQVYAAPSNITARPTRPRLIAESILSPVWQPL